MKIVMGCLLFFMLISFAPVQAESIFSSTALDAAMDEGYYGIFFDADFHMAFSGVSTDRGNYIDTDYLANGIITYRQKFKDRFEVNCKALFFAEQYYHARIDEEDIFPYTESSWGEKGIAVNLESIIDIADNLKADIALIGRQETENGDLWGLDHKYDRSSLIFQAGIVMEGIKGIHIETPGYDFKKGLFAKVYYRTYLSNKFDGYSYNEDHSWFIGDISYSILKPDLMLTPSLIIQYNTKTEINQTLAAIQLQRDYSRKMRLTSSLSMLLTDGASIESSADFSLDLILHYYRYFKSFILDITPSYELSILSDGDNAIYNSDSTTISTIGLGVNFKFGY